MEPRIRVAILDDHQSTVDGYLFRLSGMPQIEVVDIAVYGQELEPMLARQHVDVLLLDIYVHVAPDNAEPYPILHVIPKLIETYPSLSVLVISMHSERALINAVMQAGASGYILKDDRGSLQDLPAVVLSVANGGIYYSPRAHEQLLKSRTGGEASLTPRQLQALSLCAAHPDVPLLDIARELGIANSTLRNLLSDTYLRLGVRTRSAAVSKARQQGLITPFLPAVLPEQLA